MVFVLVCFYWFLFGWWMDGLVVFVQCELQPVSPITFVEPHSVVYVVLHRSYKSPCNIGVCQGDDVIDAFTLKELFNHWLERTVVVRIDGHRKTHYLETLLQTLKNAHSVFVLHRHYISKLAEDVYDHQTVSRLIVFGYDDFLVRFLLDVLRKRNHIHYIYLILKTGKGCCVRIVPSVLSNLFVRLLFKKRSHINRCDGGVFFFCFLEDVLDWTETFGGVIVDVADDVVLG